ncbi:hypothetical protein BKA64DRAFT_160726 [Cadophora sp. MPI-SDFR-AT-0126]|nr:hypothetical protein BKA64DRAFT_160726 [Leotiomycetes sp. MPI-SDFR-AT-0126]
MGYKDNPEATKETYDDDGFLHTGDLGSIDERGLVTIHDRIKELIKVSQNHLFIHANKLLKPSSA